MDSENLDGASAEIQAAFHRFLARGVGLVFLGVRDAPLRLSSLNFSVEVNKPTAAGARLFCFSFRSRVVRKALHQINISTRLELIIRTAPESEIAREWLRNDSCRSEPPMASPVNWIPMAPLSMRIR